MPEERSSRDSRSLNVGDVLERDFVRLVADQPHESEVGEDVTVPRRAQRTGRSTAAAPTGAELPRAILTAIA